MPAGRRLSRLVRTGAPVDDALRRVARRCEAPRELAARGLEHRASGASDADPLVAAAMAARADAWPEAVTVDTSGPLGSAVSTAVAAIRPYGADQAPVFRRPYLEPD